VTTHLPLAEGETVIWQGAPDPRRTGASYLIHALIGAAFTGAALVGVLRAAMLVALALAFAAGGLLFLMLPWIMRRLAARTTVALTTTRLVVLRCGRAGDRLRWTRYEDIAEIACHVRPDGSGDLLIRHRDGAENDIETGLWDSLLGLPEIARVEAELRRRLGG
jgi:hypothetical protein